jgi:uncharacterized membrane protein SpoIIM required for sporulation
MRETNFIRQNQHKWEAFEKIVDGQTKDPEKLHDLFVQVTDDLSFSRTFYPYRSVRVYLNGLAQHAFFLVYDKRRKFKLRPGTFWMEELPQLIWESRFELLLSAGVFLLSMLIGILSSVFDPSFAQIILGDSYVAMTEANIDSGDPMAVYKARESLSMSVGITVNNLWVAFTTFVSGLFFTLGSLFILIRNGVMVGAFQYFFVERNLFWDSFLTIWMHGTLEISSIIIAGAAGITMGKGLVFPGTYRRVQSFQRAARRGLKIMLGITPIFILAGFIEGFFTRYTDAPDFLRGTFIGSSFLFVVVYFGYYPWSKYRNGFSMPLGDAQMQPDRERNVEIDRIKHSGEVFSDAFSLFGKYATNIAGWAVIASGSYILALSPFLGTSFDEVFPVGIGMGGALSALTSLFFRSQFLLFPIAGILWGAAITGGALLLLRKTTGAVLSLNLQEVLSVLPAAVAIPVLVYFSGAYFPIFLAFFGHIFVLWAYTSYYEKLNLWQGLVRMLLLTRRLYSHTLGVSLLMVFTGALVFTIADSTLASFLLSMITLVVDLPEEVLADAAAFVRALLHLGLLGMVYMFFVIGCGVLYHNLTEIQEAKALLKKIPFIGTGNKIRGLEKE